MPFTVSITFPFDHAHLGEEFGTTDAVSACARAAEQAGFSAGAVTDHPVPTARWLEVGGHYAQDPFVILGMVAAVTTRLRLQTNIIVLPYRNPFVTARAVSSLDAFSRGRVLFGMGAGYLKGEYKALGVEFDRRNELMDEYIQAMKLAWTGEEFTFEGTGYTAPGNRIRPAPAQKPHPPLLIGGNSRRAIRRAVEVGDAWYPFLVPETVSQTARTANMTTDEDILAGMDYMREVCARVGRSDPPKVICSGSFVMTPGWSAQEAIDNFLGLKALGLAGSGAGIEANSVSEWCEQATRFGEEVIAKLD